MKKDRSQKEITAVYKKITSNPVVDLVFFIQSIDKKRLSKANKHSISDNKGGRIYL